jgi:ribonuclease BN (tRNA processing enzyme)
VKEGAAAAAEENAKVQEFMRGADLLVHDTQYTHKEWLAGKQGWGHSTFEWAINTANKAGVKHLVLFHHDPDRSDAKLEELADGYRTAIAGKSRMQISIAQEGRTFEV